MLLGHWGGAKLARLALDRLLPGLMQHGHSAGCGQRLMKRQPGLVAELSLAGRDCSPCHLHRLGASVTSLKQGSCQGCVAVLQVCLRFEQPLPWWPYCLTLATLQLGLIVVLRLDQVQLSPAHTQCSSPCARLPVSQVCTE